MKIAAITLEFETNEFASAVMEYFDNLMIERDLDFSAFANDNKVTIFDVDLSDWTGSEVINAINLSVKNADNFLNKKIVTNHRKVNR